MPPDDDGAKYPMVAVDAALRPSSARAPLQLGSPERTYRAQAGGALSRTTQGCPDPAELPTYGSGLPRPC